MSMIKLATLYWLAIIMCYHLFHLDKTTCSRVQVRGLPHFSTVMTGTRAVL